MKMQHSQSIYEKLQEPRSKIAPLPHSSNTSRQMTVNGLGLNRLKALNDKDLTKLSKREVARELLAIFVMLLMIVYLVWEME